MLPARVGKIPALFNTTFFLMHAGIFYHAFHSHLHFAGIFKLLQEYYFSEFPTHAGSMFLAHLKSVHIHVRRAQCSSLLFLVALLLQVAVNDLRNCRTSFWANFGVYQYFVGGDHADSIAFASK